MNRYELLRKCQGAALLMKDAQKKLDLANRHLNLPVRKPVGVAVSAHSQTAQSGTRASSTIGGMIKSA